MNVVDSGSPIVRSIVATHPATSPYKLYYSMQLYFQNGGGPCYILSIADYTSGAVAYADFIDATKGISQLEKVDEPTLILFPDAVGIPLSTGLPTNYGNLVVAALTQCAKLGDRFTISDIPEDILSDVGQFRTAIGQK